MRQFVTFSLAAAALIGAAGVAYAQADRTPALNREQVEQRSLRAFARMDANQDGKLDDADRAARLKARVDRLDVDRNGSISLDEFSAARDRGPGLRGGRSGRGSARPGEAMSRRADGNRDGTVTQAEFTGAALARFDRLDADNDGTLEAGEAPVRGAMQPRRGRGLR